MSIKKTLGVLVLFLLGLGYILYVEVPKDERSAEAQKLFGTLTPERIAEVVVNRKGETYTLKNTTYASGSEPRRDDRDDPEAAPAATWRFNGIEGAGLDDAALTSLTSALADLRAGTPLPKEEVEGDRAVYGLSDPELTLRISGRFGDRKEFVRELRFGKTNEFVRQRYVEVREAKGSVDEDSSSGATPETEGSIYLMSEGLFSAANRPGVDFRNKTVVSFVDSDVASLRLNGTGGEVVIERMVEEDLSDAVVRRSPWKIISSEIGEAVAASEEEVASVFRELRNTRAADFIDGVSEEGLASFGFQNDSPRLTVNFKKESSSPMTLRFHSIQQKDVHGRGPGAYLAKSDSTLVFASTDPTEKLFRSGEALRDRAVFRVPTHRLSEMVINRLDGEQISLRKSAAGVWSLDQSKDEKEPQVADAAFVDELIGNLTRLKAVAFPKDSRDFGLSPARASVTVSLDEEASEGSKETAPQATIHIGARVSDSPEADYYAKVTEIRGGEAEEVVFTLSAADVGKILPSRETLAPVPTPPPAPSEANKNT